MPFFSQGYSPGRRRTVCRKIDRQWILQDSRCKRNDGVQYTAAKRRRVSKYQRCGAGTRYLHCLGSGIVKRKLPEEYYKTASGKIRTPFCGYIYPARRSSFLEQGYSPGKEMEKRTFGQAGDIKTDGSTGGWDGGAFRKQRMTLKRSPSIWICIEPCCSSIRLLAIDRPSPLPSVYREESPRTNRSISSSG